MLWGGLALFWAVARAAAAEEEAEDSTHGLAVQTPAMQDAVELRVTEPVGEVPAVQSPAIRCNEGTTNRLLASRSLSAPATAYWSR